MYLISEWCANFNVHSANVLTMRQPGYIQPSNILLGDGNTIFCIYFEKGKGKQQKLLPNWTKDSCSGKWNIPII